MSEHSERSRSLPGPLIVFVACIVVYMANGRPHPEVDCMAAPYVAWSLARHGSYEMHHHPELRKYVGTIHLREKSNGAWVGLRTPGSALAAVPLMVPLAVVRAEPLGGSGMQHLGKLAAALAVAGASALFFAICKSVAPAAAWPATILFAFGTCLYSVASQALWTHGPAAFWLCGALYCLTRSDDNRPAWKLLAGCALGMAVFTRPTTAFFAMATGGALLARRQWRGALQVAAGGILPFVALCLYNWVNFGDPLLGGYDNDNWSESPPLWLGLGGLLIAPSRGVLVYTPALLLVFPGIWLLATGSAGKPSGMRVLLLAWTAAAAVTLLFYARWHDWRGGWCYGPRFLCETMPIACLLFAIAYDQISHAWMRGMAGALVALSVLVHLIGIAGHSAYEDWQDRHDLPDQGRCLWELHDTQIEAHARALVEKLIGPSASDSQ
jgi:hypothetical protein